MRYVICPQYVKLVLSLAILLIIVVYSHKTLICEGYKIVYSLYPSFVAVRRSKIVFAKR